MMFLKKISLFFVLFLNACAFFSNNPATAPAVNVIDTADRTLSDPKIKNRSDLLHNYLMGEMSLSKQEVHQAIDYFAETSEGLEKPIDNFHYNLALLYFSERNLKKALDEINLELQANASSWNAQYLKAGLLFAAADYAEVKKFYKNSMALHPAKPEPLLQQYRLACVEQKEFLAFKHGQRLHTDFSNAANVLAIGKTKATTCRSAEELGIKLALFYLQSGQVDETLRELYILLYINPDHSQARLALANTYAGQGKRQQAIQELLKIKSADSQFIRAHTLAAFYSQQSGDISQSERILEDLWNASNHSLEVLPFYISILREQNKAKEAKKLVESLLKRDSKNAGLWYEYSILLHNLGDIESSNEAMEEVLKINPEHAQALNHIAYNLAEESQDLTRALTLIKKALKNYPTDAAFIDTLGWIYYRQGEFEKAKKELALAVEISNNEWLIVEHYADALLALNEKSKALEWYRLALEQVLDQDLETREDLQGIERLQRKIKDTNE